MICENCRHGTCIRPNFCLCHNGYSRVNDRCKPVCSPPCVNSKCIAPNVCECHHGFHRHHLAESHNCSAVENIGCNSSTCINGYCNSVYQCRCHKHFEFAPGSQTLCVHRCNTGHRLNYHTTDGVVCQPVCDSINCENGHCASPNLCTCNKGYRRRNNKCQPTSSSSKRWYESCLHCYNSTRFVLQYLQEDQIRCNSHHLGVV